MLNQQNPFETQTGSNKLIQPMNIGLVLVTIVISAWVISRIQVPGGILLIALPFIFVYSYYLFRYPIVGLYTAIGLGFILLGLGKYITGLQLGTVMDGTLMLTVVALFFNRFKDRIDLTPARKDITFFAILWFGYYLFEFVNPEAKSTEAWFSGRGVALYFLLIVPLTFLLIDNNKKLNTFFYLWGVISVLASMKGIMQHFWGVDQWEMGWLNEGNFKTHILFGKLRSFSFMSDAGQFGANQAYTAVVAIIFSMAQKNLRAKLFFILVAVLGLYGMVLSGTRGAMSIPIAGLMTFFVLRKNIKVMIFGFILIAMVFVFFKFTSIGQGNNQIRRMRTAFDPNDASLQVRIENQKRLRTYLASRPFGGGVGLGGVKAQKYLPYAYLSQVATDSGYVLIWVEEGIVGLLLHLFILFYVVARSSFAIMFRIRDPLLRLKMGALTSGMAGIMVANYGNAVLMQMPTSMLIYTSMALMMNSEVFDIPKKEIANAEIK